MSSGPNDVVVEATDGSGNVRTSTYRLEVSAAGGTYSYDANGNLETKVDNGSTWTYEWNATNQLKRVLNNGVEVARFGYDPLGRRVEKVAEESPPATSTTAWTSCRENRGGTISTYVHGPWIDEPLAKESGAATSYFHADGLGSVVKTTDQWRGRLDDPLRRLGQPESRERQTSTRSLAGSGTRRAGLYYYRARYYDPEAWAIHRARILSALVGRR